MPYKTREKPVNYFLWALRKKLEGNWRWNCSAKACVPGIFKKDAATAWGAVPRGWSPKEKILLKKPGLKRRG